MNESPEFVTLQIEDKMVRLPVVVGSEGEKAIDIANLRRETGYVTLDPSFMNTAACYSQITYIDGEKGILRYRGIPIEDLVKKTMFVEVAYLLVHGELPTEDERQKFSELLNVNSMLHEDMRHFFDHFPAGAHPMHILSTMINALAAFYPNVDLKSMADDIDVSTARLISIVRTMAAFAYKKSIGDPVVYPRHDLSYCANFLNMMFDSPVKPYQIHPEAVRILNILFILHADHEQNCSTTTVRTVGSAQVNLYATISAGISALSGPLHGGANAKVMQMFRDIREHVGEAPDDAALDAYLDRILDGEAGDRSGKIYGLGHAVYTMSDPRAVVIKKYAASLASAKGRLPDLELMERVETRGIEKIMTRKHQSIPMCANVDLYSGLIYSMLDIPEDLYTPLFATARIAGWCAHRLEELATGNRIMRPAYRAMLIKEPYIPVEARK